MLRLTQRHLEEAVNENRNNASPGAGNRREMGQPWVHGPGRAHAES